MTVYARHDPDGGRLSLARYAEEVAWHEGEGVYADGTGIAKTTECYVLYFEEDRREEAVETLRCALSQPHVSVTPEWMDRCGAAGGFAASTLVDAGRQGIPADPKGKRDRQPESRSGARASQSGGGSGAGKSTGIRPDAANPAGDHPVRGAHADRIRGLAGA